MGYIPKHRRTTLRRRLAGVVAITATLGTVLVAAASPASAFDNYTEAYASDGQSVGRCALTITNADYSAGTVRANVNASVRPVSLTKALQNAHVGISCAIIEKDGFTVLRVDNYEADGTLIGKARISTLPLASDYLICTAVATTLRSGATISSPYNCVG